MGQNHIVLAASTGSLECFPSARIIAAQAASACCPTAFPEDQAWLAAAESRLAELEAPARSSRGVYHAISKISRPKRVMIDVFWIRFRAPNPLEVGGLRPQTTCDSEGSAHKSL